MKGAWPVCRGSWNVGVGRSNPSIVIYTPEPRAVSQKPSPCPAGRDAPPIIQRARANKLVTLGEKRDGPLRFSKLRTQLKQQKFG